jgi:hypothetical protein
MIRFLFIGVGVGFLTLGWLLLFGPSEAPPRVEKSSSEPIAKLDSSIPASQQVPSWKSPVSHPQRAALNHSAQVPVDLKSGIKSNTTQSPAANSKTYRGSSATKSFLQNPSSSKNSYSQTSNAFSGVGGGGAPREISIPVPQGAKVPAVFFDVEEKPIAQQKALDRIAQEFEKNVSEIPQGLTQEEVWEVARAIADERYLTLFGYQAFNQYHIESAKEALKEKKSHSKPTGP